MKLMERSTSSSSSASNGKYDKENQDIESESKMLNGNFENLPNAPTLTSSEIS
jgi:hypothetical protein